MSQQLTPTTPVITPTGRRGEILEPPGGGAMPNHALVQFPDGPPRWVLASILTVPTDE